MLTDTALRNLSPQSLMYKVSDRDGMYVTVSATGTVTFRYDYSLSGRHETLTIGRYCPGGIWLAPAREKLLDAKKAVAAGRSPALEKPREKRRLTCCQESATSPSSNWRAPGWLTTRARCASTSSIATSCRCSRTGCSTKSLPMTCAPCAAR